MEVRLAHTGKILSGHLPADIQTGRIARKNHHLKYPNSSTLNPVTRTLDTLLHTYSPTAGIFNSTVKLSYSGYVTVISVYVRKKGKFNAKLHSTRHMYTATEASYSLAAIKLKIVSKTEILSLLTSYLHSLPSSHVKI